MKRNTIGTNPPDLVAPEKTAKERPNTKEDAMFHLPVDLMERIRNCVYWTPGLTMGEPAEEGLRKVLETYEKKNGGTFRPRKSNLKGGRSMK
jgi:hypothetical protein